MTKWYENDDPEKVVKSGAWRLGVWVLIIVGISLLIGALTWGAKVLLSDPVGQGNAIIQKNSSTNRIFAQQNFEERYQDILGADRRIDVVYLAWKSDKSDPTLTTNYTGTVNYCIDAVAEYNADARKFLLEDFKAQDLPDVISNTNPLTDCKESK
jgi:hypothetical protein